MSAELQKIVETPELEIEGIVTGNWHRLSVDEKVERILESQKKELTLDKFLALFKGHEEEQLIDISANKPVLARARQDYEIAKSLIAEGKRSESARYAVKAYDVLYF